MCLTVLQDRDSVLKQCQKTSRKHEQDHQKEKKGCSAHFPLYFKCAFIKIYSSDLRVSDYSLKRGMHEVRDACVFNSSMKIKCVSIPGVQKYICELG